MGIIRNEIDRVFFESGLVRIGAFRCHPEHPSFQDTGPIKNYCFVFPRTAVGIQHEHEPAFVANANVVTFYNFGQVYLRDPISPEGDNCDWFGVESELVRDVVGAFDSRVDNRPERPFALSRGWSDASTYFLQPIPLASSLASERKVQTIVIQFTISKPFSVGTQRSG